MKTKMITKVASFSAAVLLFFLSACSDLTTVRLPSAKTKSTVGKLVELQVHWKIGGVPDGVMPFSVGGKQQLFSFTLADDVDDVTLLMRTSPDIRIEYLVTDVFEHITSESLSTKDAVIAPGYQSIDIDMSYRVETNIYLHVGNLIYTVKLLKAVPTKCYYVRETGDGGSTIDDVRGGTNRGKRPETAFFSLKHAAYMATLTDIREIYVIGELKSDPQVDPQADSLFVVDGTSEHAIRVRGMRDTVTGRDGALDASGTGKRVMNVNKSTVTFVGLKFVGGGDGETTITEGGGIKITGDMQNSRFVQSNVRFYNCVITGNKTYGMGKGGGVYAESSIVKFEFTTVSDNYSNSEGGGIYATAKDESSPASVITVSGGEVSANKAYAKGGGLYIGGATATVGSTLTVMNNAAVKNNILDGGKGGGIYVGGDTVQRSASTDGYTLTFDSAKVWGNTVGFGSGSGVYFSGTEFYFRGNSVVGHENATTPQQLDERQFGNIIEMQDDRQLTVDTSVPLPSAANGVAAVVEVGAVVGTQVLIGSGINDSTRRFARFRPRRAEIGLYCDKIWGYNQYGTLYASDTIHVAASGGSDSNDGLSADSPLATFERACTAANIFTAPKIQISGYLTAANHSDSYAWATDSDSSFTVAIPASQYHAPISIAGADNASGFAAESTKRVLAIKDRSQMKFTGTVKLDGSTTFAVENGSAFYVAPNAAFTAAGNVIAPAFSVLSEGPVTVDAGATLDAWLRIVAGNANITASIAGTLAQGATVGSTGSGSVPVEFGGGAVIKGAFIAENKAIITTTGNFSAIANADGYEGRISLQGDSRFTLEHTYSGIVDVLYGTNFTMNGPYAKVAGAKGRVWLGRKAGVTEWSDAAAVADPNYAANNWATVNVTQNGSGYGPQSWAAKVYLGMVWDDPHPPAYYSNGEMYDYKRPIVKYAHSAMAENNRVSMANTYWHVRKEGFSDLYGHLRVDPSESGAPASEFTDFSKFTNVLSEAPGRSEKQYASSAHGGDKRLVRRTDSSGAYVGWQEIYSFHRAASGYTLAVPAKTRIRVLLVGGGGGGGGADDDFWGPDDSGEHGGNGSGGIGERYYSSADTLKFDVGDGGNGSAHVMVSDTVPGSHGGDSIFYVSTSVSVYTWRAYGGYGGNGADNSDGWRRDYRNPGAAYGAGIPVHENYTGAGLYGKKATDTSGGRLNDGAGREFFRSNFASLSDQDYLNRGFGGLTSFNGGWDGSKGGPGWVVLNVEYPVGN